MVSTGIKSSKLLIKYLAKIFLYQKKFWWTSFKALNFISSTKPVLIIAIVVASCFGD